jgi:hypothetical protein
MENGFIYPIAKKIVNILKYLNIVELLKFLSTLLAKSESQKMKYRNITIDLFIVSKWMLILILILLRANCVLISSIVFYLIFFNCFTYFYYHIWEVSIRDKEHKRRRFINLLLSIAFSIFAFSYIYFIPFCSEYNWSNESIPGFLAALRFSLNNSFAFGTSIDIKSTIGYIIAMSQQIISFVFIAMVLSQAIPNGEENDGKA